MAIESPTACIFRNFSRPSIPMPLNLPLIVRTILDEYALPWDGDHGVAHWARVFENGLRLAEVTGANVEVVQLFAVFHDSKRVKETKRPILLDFQDRTALGD